MIVLSTRAGTYSCSCVCAWTSSSRSAASTAAGVVSCSDQTPWISAVDAVIGSNGAPLVAVAQDRVLLGGTRGAGLVLRDRTGVLPPRLEDRVDDPPRSLDLVVAREQRGVA